MRLKALIVLAVLVGGGLGGVLALRLLHVSDSAAGETPATRASVPRAEPRTEPAPDPDPVPVIAPGHSSYYFDRLRRSGVDIDQMTPLLLTGKSREDIQPSCPDRLSIVSGEGSYESGVQPYVAALDPSGLVDGLAGASGLARDVATQLNRSWRTFEAKSRGPVGDPPLRILVKHYPRVDLPGRCIAVQVTLYDVVDMYFDQAAMEPYKERIEDAPRMRGAICDIFRTYQIEGGRARLVQALVETHTSILVLPQRMPITEFIGNGELGRAVVDGGFSGHFLAFGGGDRNGLIWIDRSSGLGDPDPWAVAFRVRRIDAKRPPTVERAPLDAAAIRLLLAYVKRA